MRNATQYANGTVTGTGAAISVNCGFIPRKVKLMNITGKCVLEWNDQMGDGYGYKIPTGIDATADTVSLHSYITTGGITKGTRTTLLGFIIGTDADINVNAERIIYEAWE